MKMTHAVLKSCLCIQLGICTSTFAAEATIKIKENLKEGSSILVHTGTPIPTSISESTPDFELVSGDEAVYGDPTLGQTEAYTSWKEACADWKKEVKKLNEDNQVLMINCNHPTSTREKTGLMTYHSRGTYKIRVALKKTQRQHPEPLPQNPSTP